MDDTDAALIIEEAREEISLTDIHDIQSLVDAPNTWGWLWWTLLILAVLSALWLGYRRYRKNREAKLQETARVRREPPHERARKLLAEALTQIHDPDRFCVLVSDAVRRYLEERFELRAPEQTTEEFLEELKHNERLSLPHKELLVGFLNECDLVKFARSSPEAYELQQLHDAALGLVRDTEPSLMESEETEAPARP